MMGTFGSRVSRSCASKENDSRANDEECAFQHARHNEPRLVINEMVTHFEVRSKHHANDDNACYRNIIAKARKAFQITLEENLRHR